MKHATPLALDRLEDLLGRLRKHDDLRERQRGVFYHRSRAFLHFHEDPSGLFADLRLNDDFDRFPVNSEAERSALLKRVKAFLNPRKETKGKVQARVAASNPPRTRR